MGDQHAFIYLVTHGLRIAALLLAVALLEISAIFAQEEIQASARRRQPVAAMLANGTTLVTADERAGTLSAIDLASGKVVAEPQIGKSISHLALLPEGRKALAVDRAANELIALEIRGHEISVLARLSTAASPVHVSCDVRGKRACVASLWRRCVEIVELSQLEQDPPVMRTVARIDLPFAPRLTARIKDGLVVVADAFGGRMACVDLNKARLLAVHSLTGHNLRGLCLTHDGRELLVAHQRLNSRLPTTEENLQEGRLISNGLRRIPIEAILRPAADLDSISGWIRLGEPGHGAGDPAGVVALDEGRAAVALAGVDEVAIAPLDSTSTEPRRRIAVGQRPLALVELDKDRLAVVNSLGDSLTVLDLSTNSVAAEISLGPQPPLTPQERGERQFFNARLSHDGSVSCHSCHTDGHTNGLLADTPSDNTFGAPKRTLTLFGTALTYRWAWNGQIANLNEQVRKSLAETLRSRTANEGDVNDLVAYLHTLPPPPPLAPAPGDDLDREQLARGRKLFASLRCGDCHIPPLVYTSHEPFDVGLVDERGLSKFNPPSLRGVGQLPRLLHDNRADSLESVFTEHGHPHGTFLSSDEAADLARFLRSL